MQLEDEVEEIEDFEIVGEPALPSEAGGAAGAIPASNGMPVASSTHKSPDAKVVFVVEDDPSIRTMIVLALAANYTVFEAEDGQAALEILAKIPPPACIISDWMMPRLDGLELAKRVRSDKNVKGTPIIILTAKTLPLDVVQVINAGAQKYVPKPIAMKDLLEKLAIVLAK